jgi:lysophospholipase L1-like esterase
VPAWRALRPSPHGEILTVLIGSNDAMSPRHRSLLPEAFTELLTVLPAGAIVSTVPSPAGPGREASEIIRTAGDAGAIRVVSAGLDPGTWRGRLAADRFHPNDDGYAMIVEVFADAVRDALAAVNGRAKHVSMLLPE